MKKNILKDKYININRTMAESIIERYIDKHSLLYTATLNEFFMLWRVRKKVSIPLKAPEAPLFEYVN